MAFDRVPFLLALASLLLGSAFLLAVQPYSVPSHWSRFDEPGRLFAEAALRQDTAALEQLSDAQQPVHWAMRAAQTEGVALAAWANSARAASGFSLGETTEVWYDTPTDACPFRLTFVGQQHPRVVRAYARCFIGRGWPTDPSVIAVPR